MNSLTDLREVVDVVIGVDTHVHAHSAAVVDAATGGVLDEITVEATAEGYGELVEFANNHAMLRAWAIEGTGGHGAGLSRHLLEMSEIVIELDRPKRAARRMVTSSWTQTGAASNLGRFIVQEPRSPERVVRFSELADACACRRPDGVMAGVSLPESSLSGPNGASRGGIEAMPCPVRLPRAKFAVVRSPHPENTR